MPLHAAGATFAAVLPVPGVHTDGQGVPPPGYVQAFVVTPSHVPAHIALPACTRRVANGRAGHRGARTEAARDVARLALPDRTRRCSSSRRRSAH